MNEPKPKISDADLVTAAATAMLGARRSTADKIKAAMNGFEIATRNALEQPHQEWTSRELERARKRLEAYLGEES